MDKNLKKVCLYIGIILLIVLWLMPIVFVVITSTKTNMEFYTTPVFSFPENFCWANFKKAFITSRLYIYMRNSLMICLIKVPIGLFVESLTAFALTRMKIKHSKAIFIFILIGMMIPLQALLLPINIVVGKLNMTNSLLTLALIYLGIQLPFGVLVFRGFMKSIPMEIDESARIDGCSNLRLYWSIILPISKPAVATMIILDSLYTWNEFLFSSLINTQTNVRTVPAGILVFYGETVVDYPKLCAGILILIVPILIVYLIFQRYFIEGVSGAVKG